MTVQITDAQAVNATIAGIDSDDAYATGIINTSNAVVVPKLEGYSSQPTSVRDTIKASIKGLFAVLTRYFDTVSASVYSIGTGTVINDGSEHEVASTSVLSYVSRTVQVTISCNIKCSSSASYIFYPKVNGTVALPQLPFTFSPPIVDNVQMSFPEVQFATSSSWIVTVPAGATTISANMQRTAGSGILTLGGDGWVTMTVIG